MLVRGEPLRDLLGAVATGRAHLLVVGARGTSGVRYSLLGSVAEDALNQSPVSVLVARQGESERPRVVSHANCRSRS
jgi:nucleotide-binding universal stress UspA family protein